MLEFFSVVPSPYHGFKNIYVPLAQFVIFVNLCRIMLYLQSSSSR